MILLSDIKQNWILILFVGSLIIGWTTFNSRLGVAEAQISENIGIIADYARQLNTLNANVFIICSSLKLTCIQPK